MNHTITLIPGDGIGPEVSSAVVRVIEATGVSIDWETHYAGAQAQAKFGTTLPEELLESIRRNKVALKGPTQCHRIDFPEALCRTVRVA